MSNSLYYGEIANYIYDHFCKYPDHLIKLDHLLDDETEDNTDVYLIAGDAAYVFSVVQEIFDKDSLDWMSILKTYADYLLDNLLIGEKPRTIDLLEIMTDSIQSVH